MNEIKVKYKIKILILLKNYFCLSILTFFSINVAYCQLSSKDILQKCILVHDPNGNWEKLNAWFDISIVREKHKDRYFTININRPKDIFSYSVTSDTLHYAQGYKKNRFVSSFNKSKRISAENIKKYDLTPERTLYLKEVYEYLMLIPMRLKNDRNYLLESFESVTFNGSDCYRVTFIYEPHDDNETWYFFIDKKTYMLKGYQFFEKDISSDGEFIFLEHYINAHGILFPTSRIWYWNKDGSHFRTDKILSIR